MGPTYSSEHSFLAEREGFEPSVGVTYTRFPSVRLKPLGHLSIKYYVIFIYQKGVSHGNAIILCLRRFSPPNIRNEVF